MVGTGKQVRNAVRYISESAEEAYEQLLRNGSITIDRATSLTHLSIITELENYGFVFREAASAGYIFFPTPLEILIPSLLHRLDWSYPPFIDIPENERECLHGSLKQLLDDFPPRESSQPDAPKTAQVLEGAANIDTFIARILGDTRDACAISAAEWSTNLPLVWGTLSQRIKEGMRYRRIVSPLGLAAFGWAVNDRDTREIGVDLRVSLATTLSPFYLFSGEHLHSAIVFGSSTVENSRARATYTALGQLTKRLSEIFDDLWDTATPANTILKRLQAHRSIYIERALQSCGVDGRRVAGLLFDKGIFSDFSSSDSSHLSSLVSSGLAITSNYTIGFTKYVPNIIDELTSYAHEQESASGK